MSRVPVLLCYTRPTLHAVARLVADGIRNWPTTLRRCEPAGNGTSAPARVKQNPTDSALFSTHMAHIATPEFLSRLKQLYPPEPDYVNSAWYPVAAITFTASNCPAAVPRVLEYVLNDLDAISAPHNDRLTAARKIRDAVFKSGLICGFPKVSYPIYSPVPSSQVSTQVINALIPLLEATPPDLRDTETLRCVLPGGRFRLVLIRESPLRNPDPTIQELALAGQAYFDTTYGDTAKTTQDLLTAIYPDLGMSLVPVPSPSCTTTPTRIPGDHHGLWLRVRLYGRNLARRNVLCNDSRLDRHRHAPTNRMALARCTPQRRDERPSESSARDGDSDFRRGGHHLEGRHPRSRLSTLSQCRSRDSDQLRVGVWRSVKQSALR